MRKPETVKTLETLGRKRLSRSFYMRDFLYSEISQIAGIPNIPADPDLALAAGTRLCEALLEPLQAHFGRIVIRSAYRSEAVNDFGNKNNLNCASNEANYADHIWDRRDENGDMGATACIVIPSFADRFNAPGDWQRLAWWIHDHLPYATMVFYPKLWAVNLQWHQTPIRRIDSWTAPKGCLTKPDMDNHADSHAAHYQGLPTFDSALCTSEAVRAPAPPTRREADEDPE